MRELEARPAGEHARIGAAPCDPVVAAREVPCSIRMLDEAGDVREGLPQALFSMRMSMHMSISAQMSIHESIHVFYTSLYMCLSGAKVSVI